MNPTVMLLSDLPERSAEVGYGRLGVRGDLGYENGRVHFGGTAQIQAISAHGPSRIVYQLDGRYRRFDARVAFNQDVAGRDTHAHFLVCADGREIACAPLLRPKDGARELSGDVRGASKLELIVLTDRWEYCHSLWLDARVSGEPPPVPLTTWEDPLHRARIHLLMPKPNANRCVATVVSPGFEEHLHDLLWSLRTFGKCDDALVVVFAVNPNERCHALARNYKATIVECQPSAGIGLAIKSLLYAVASVIDAQWYLCLDADTLILGSLDPIFAACELAPPGRILVCREANHTEPWRLGSAIRQIYYGREEDLGRIVGDTVNDESEYPLVVNDGVFAGGKQALLALEAQIRRMPHGVSWMENTSRGCWWRNQFLFNLALARLRNGWELDNVFNVQLHTHDVVINGETEARFRGRPVHILHLCGVGKHKHVEWRRKLREHFSHL